MFLQHPLDGALLKLQRAEKHIEDLRTEVRTFHESKPYSISVEINAEPGKHVVRAHVHRTIPTALSLLVGDAAHNLRCVLDHLVWELSMQHWSSRPDVVSKPDQQTQFPIFRHPPTGNDHPFWKKVKSLAPDVVTAIQGLQPYVVSSNEPQSHPLWLLNDLDIWDKHKRIALTLATPSRVRYAMRKWSGETVHGTIDLGAMALGPHTWLPFEEGAKVVTLSNTVGRFKDGPFVLDTSIVDVKADVTVEVAFGHELAAQFKPAVPMIEACLAATRVVVDALSPFFPPRR